MDDVASFINPPKKSDCRINSCLIGISIILGTGPKYHTGSSLSAIANLHGSADYPFSEAIYLIGDSIQRFNLALYSINYIDSEIECLQKELLTSKANFIDLESQKSSEIKELEARVSDLQYLKAAFPDIDSKSVTENDVKKVLDTESATILFNIINFEDETVASLKIRLVEWLNFKDIDKFHEKQAEALCEVIAYYYSDVAINLGARWLARNKSILDEKKLIMFSEIENFSTKKPINLSNIEKKIDDIYFDSSVNCEFIKGINKDVDTMLGRFPLKLADARLEIQRLFIKVYLKKECAIIGYQAIEGKSKYFSYPSEKLNTLMLVNEHVIVNYRRNVLNWLQIKISKAKPALKGDDLKYKKEVSQVKLGEALSFFTNKMSDNIEIKRVKQIAQPEIAKQFSDFCYRLLMIIIKEKDWTVCGTKRTMLIFDFLNKIKNSILKNPFLHKASVNAKLGVKVSEEERLVAVDFYNSLFSAIYEEKEWNNEKIKQYMLMIQSADYVNNSFIEIISEINPPIFLDFNDSNKKEDRFNFAPIDLQK